MSVQPSAFRCQTCVTDKRRCPEQYRNGELACHDCGLLYSGPGWLDTTIPNEHWTAISPTGHHGGILCITCIARRLDAAGRADVALLVGSGPFSHDPSYWWHAGFDAGRDRLSYEFHHGEPEPAP